MGERRTPYATKREITVADLPALSSEGSLQERIRKLAAALHLHYFHPWTSIHSPSGFPDTVILHQGRLCVWLFAWELKREGKDATAAQAEWLELFEALAMAGSHELRMDVGVRRPSDWPEIEALMIEAWEDR